MATSFQQWQFTDSGDENEQAVPVRDAALPQNVTGEMQTVSRRPAAIVGILLVVGMTAMFFRGVDTLTGQLVDAISIRITATGIEPIVVEAQRGDTISWVNEQDIPHYLTSDTLCNVNDECLNTSTMFQGDETNYTIPDEIAPGDYNYFSPTDPSLVGTIRIGEAGAAAPAGTTSTDIPPATDEQIDSVSNSLIDAIRRQLELDQQALQTTQSPQQQPTQAVQQPQYALPGLTQNPYTVGNPQAELPFAPVEFAGEETPDAYQEAMEVSTTSSNLIGQTVQKPMSQPSTGPGVWVMIAMGGFAVWLVTKRTFTAYTRG